MPELTRVRWQDLYGVEQDNASASLAAHVAADPAFAATDIGVQGNGTAGGKFALPLLDHPDYKAPSTTNEAEQARGISQRHVREYNTVQTGDPFETTIGMLGDAYYGSLLAYSLFQEGTTEAVGTNTALNVLTCVPYTSADPEMYMYLTRALQNAAGSDPVDVLVKGAIVSQLTLSAEQGGLLNLEAVIKGAKWEQKDISSSLAAMSTFVNNVIPLKFQDMAAAIHDGSNWVPISIPSMSVTFTNNVVFNFYNGPAASSANMGRLGVSGTVTLPWGAPTVGKNYLIDRFLAGETRRMVFYWGTKGTPAVATDYLLSDVDRLKNGTTDVKNYVSIFVNARIVDYGVAGDNELMVEAQFEGVYDGTNNAGELRFAYDKTLLERK
jgi:hypothetical protein